ncbi:MAG: ribonuclease HII [Patescibacteria group bacterium]
MQYIIGIDEVGRGALAGPVFLAGVKIPNTFPLYTYDHSQDPEFDSTYLEFKKVRDSKMLSAKKRDEIYNLIQQQKIQQCLVSASSELIDNYGIGVCLSHMNAIIINNLNPKFDGKIIIDGKIILLTELNNLLTQSIFQENNFSYNTKEVSYQSRSIQKSTIIRENKADDKYLSVALASNLAKVARDSLMTNLNSLYPQYQWQNNKGYGTLKHRQAVHEEPKNPYLRQTFLGKIIANKHK